MLQHAVTIYLKYTNIVHKNWRARPLVLVAFRSSLCYDIQYQSTAAPLPGGTFHYLRPGFNVMTFLRKDLERELWAGRISKGGKET
jgi:hypothetical protein